MLGLNKILIFLSVAIFALEAPSLVQSEQETLAQIGERIFFNANLSLNRNISCATCHDPRTAFIDSRQGSISDGISRGTSRDIASKRNSPSIAYAASIPALHTVNKIPVGGFFYDGRAPTLKNQAKHPFLEESEMGIPNVSVLRQRMFEEASFAVRFIEFFGAEVINNDEFFFDSVSDALVAFQRSRVFQKFNSKYDKFLEGQYTMTALEKKGYQLFFSGVTNCMNCHLSNKNKIKKRDLFTDFNYYNIGTPRNSSIRDDKKIIDSERDSGLYRNSQFASKENIGKFKTPSLRNVAVTAPYMHNGVFRDLKTTIEFYNEHLVTTLPRNKKTINESKRLNTGFKNTSNSILGLGQPLDKKRVEAIEAFLKILTDEEYEHLLEAEF